MEREQFTFYASFYSSVSRIKNKAARCDAYDAICSYALTGELPDLDKLPDAAAIAFLGAKANIDASRRKAEAGKSGGRAKQTVSKPEANGKQTGSKGNEEAPGKQEKEQEKEQDKEQVQEQMLEPPTPLPPTDKAAAVLADYLDRVNPSASPASLDELRSYVDVMGPEVCRRAIDIALDSKKATWPYIRAILRDKQSRGVKCLADWEALETGRKAARESKKPGSMVGKDFQPSAERIRENADWLDSFLAEQGVEL